ncbi:hypothetical protein V5799_002801 [Amblyomma americanum]|uniref:Uncharacterized protein n=1 Tax=Amblyomma americanum TaxID=6943 RepID=A0AAQ4DAS7_AMBAM
MDLPRNFHESNVHSCHSVIIKAIPSQPLVIKNPAETWGTRRVVVVLVAATGVDDAAPRESEGHRRSTALLGSTYDPISLRP